MKKLFMMMSLMLISVLLFSCSQQEEEFESKSVAEQTFEKSDEAAFARFRLQVEELDRSYGFSRPGFYTRFNLWRLIKKALQVCYADAAGAIVGAGIGTSVSGGNPVGAVAGAVIGGVGASYAVACLPVEVETPSPHLSPAQYQMLRANALSGLIFSNAFIPTKLDSIGFYHNAVVINMYEDDASIMDSTTYSRSDLLDSVATYHHVFNISNLEMNSINKDSIISKCNSQIRSYLSLVEKTGDISIIPNTPEWENNSLVLPIIENYVVNICDENSTADLQEYTSDYLSLVDNSELSASEKQRLRMGVTVAYSSKKLWGRGLVLQ